ncbi:MAG: amino acid ABC transporter ATP-binding protein [bacterium]
MIEAHEIRKKYGEVEVLRGLSLQVHSGEVVALIGSSGSGKTTFLRCLNGLESFQSGQIRVDGLTIRPESNLDFNSLRSLRLKLGMVFQQFNLFPHLTVLGNIIEAPVRVLGLQRGEATNQAMALLQRMGLAEKAYSRPRDLSGGQQQRVAIARALAMKPAGLLFDEPTSALDPRMTGEIAALVRDLAREKLAILVVTHDMNFAKRAADRLAVFDQGKIAESGSPEELFANPESHALKELLAGH